MLNDIALVKLDNEVELNKRIQLACLPDSSIPVYPVQTNIPVWNVGWGRLGENSSTIPNLNNVKMTLYNPIFCGNLAPTVTKDWNRQICAGRNLFRKSLIQFLDLF